MDLLITILTLVIGSQAVWNFVQFLIMRKDTGVKKAIDDLSEKVDMNQAILARTHILRFDDELLNDITHSREYFAQQLQDIDTYEAYCETHPHFKNSYAVAAIAHIRSTYQKLLEQHEFKEVQT